MAIRFWVIVICLMLGYWLVSKLIERGKAAEQGSSAGAAHRKQKEDSEEGSAKRTETYTREGAAWYEVLEVDEDASADEIKAAYRRLMAQYHPDKVSSLGRELRELAEAKSKSVTQAYRRGIHLRGESW